MYIRVQKKSGRTELFSFRKIVSSIIKSGGTVELIGEVVDRLRSYLRQSDRKVLTSKDIRRHVVEALSKVNRKTANAYARYRKVAKRHLHVRKG